MRRSLHTLTAAVVIVAANGADTACEPPAPKACQIDTRGIRVEGGIVTDVITARCDPRPRTHRLDGWIEYRAEPGEKWRQPGGTSIERRRPDAEGLRMPVDAGHCIPGDYRTAWQVTGIGPGPDERPYNYTDGDFWPTTLDCGE